MTGADEAPSIVMNELDMLESPKQPTLKKGKSEIAYVRKKTVTIGDDNNTTNLERSETQQTDIFTNEDYSQVGKGVNLSYLKNGKAGLNLVKEESLKDS